MSFTFKQKEKRKYVSSKIIYFFEYDENSQELKIGFNDGLTGYFKDIPGDLINKFEAAESKGNFFYRQIISAGYRHRFELV